MGLPSRPGIAKGNTRRHAIAPTSLARSSPSRSACGTDPRECLSMRPATERGRGRCGPPPLPRQGLDTRDERSTSVRRPDARMREGSMSNSGPLARPHAQTDARHDLRQSARGAVRSAPSHPAVRPWTTVSQVAVSACRACGPRLERDEAPIQTAPRPRTRTGRPRRPLRTALPAAVGTAAVVAVAVDEGEGPVVSPAVDQLGEPAPRQLGPLCRRQRRAATRAGRAPEHREIDELDLRSFLHPGRRAAAPAAPSLGSQLDYTRSRSPLTSTMPSTRTSGSPTSSSHMRVGSTPTGALPTSTT